MTYQGERARPIAAETGRVFAVSKVRIGAHGHVSDVLWSEVGGKTDQDFFARVVVPVADVVDAIHDGAEVAAEFPGHKGHMPQRLFVVIQHEDGRECIAFDDASSPGRNLADMAKLDD
jgi:hypothetical protein